MHDVCTEQHVGNAKCASPPIRSFSLSFFLSHSALARLSFSRSRPLRRSRATLGLLRHGRAGRNINDQANHPERTSGGGQPSRRRDACNCCEPAKCRIGGGELVLAVAWLDACTGQHAFHEGKGERARGEGTGGGNIRIRSYSVCRWPFGALQPP